MERASKTASCCLSATWAAAYFATFFVHARFERVARLVPAVRVVHSQCPHRLRGRLRYGVTARACVRLLATHDVGNKSCGRRTAPEMRRGRPRWSRGQITPSRMSHQSDCALPSLANAARPPLDHTREHRLIQEFEDRDRSAEM